MLFNLFVLNQLELLERATRGYGDEITERSLYDALSDESRDAEGFAVLIEWALITGLLVEVTAVVGRRFRVNRATLPELRRRANGESGMLGPLPMKRMGRTDLGR